MYMEGQIMVEIVFGIDYFWGITIAALAVVVYTIAGGLFALSN